MSVRHQSPSPDRNGQTTYSRFLQSMTGSSAKWHTDYQKIDASTAAFTVSPKKKIPALVFSPEDRSERMNSLLSIPSHRQGGTKFDYEQSSRTIIPLT